MLQSLVWGDGPIGASEKITYNGYVFALKATKTYQWTLGTQELTPIGSKSRLGPSMDRAWVHCPIIGPYNSLTFRRLGIHHLPFTISRPFSRLVTTFSITWYYIVNQGTPMAPQMDTKMDPARLILRPLPKKGP